MGSSTVPPMPSSDFSPPLLISSSARSTMALLVRFGWRWASRSSKWTTSQFGCVKYSTPSIHWFGESTVSVVGGFLPSHRARTLSLDGFWVEYGLKLTSSFQCRCFSVLEAVRSSSQSPVAESYKVSLVGVRLVGVPGLAVLSVRPQKKLVEAPGPSGLGWVTLGVAGVLEVEGLPWGLLMGVKAPGWNWGSSPALNSCCCLIVVPLREE